jgi:hypothetical protein
VLEDLECRRLGKGRTIAKDLRISHPTNASTKIHNGNSPKELTTDAIVIWTTEN